MRLEVELSVLAGAAANLRDALAIAREVADHKARMTSLVEDSGSSTFAAAAEAFVDKWGYGVGLVADDAEKLAAMLDAGVEAYRTTEGAIAEALR